MRWFERHPKKTLFLIAVISLLVILIAAETLLSSVFAHQNMDRYVRLREHRPGVDIFIKPSQGYMLTTDSLVLKPYRFRTDQDGFILPTEVHSNSEVSFRVFFLGGSTTECMYVEEENRFPYLTGRLIEEKTRKKVNSYNAGVSGNHSYHSIIILLTKIIPKNPNIVVLMHNVNDLTILFLEHTYFNQNPSRSIIITQKTCSRLHCLKDALVPGIYNLLRNNTIIRGAIDRVVGEKDEFGHMRGQKIKIDKERLLAEFASNLYLFIDICRARGITPVLMTEQNRLKEDPDPIILTSMTAVKDFGLTYDDYRSIYSAFNKMIKHVAHNKNVQVIDLAEKVPQSAEFMYDVTHLNDNGSNFVSKIISDELIFWHALDAGR